MVIENTSLLPRARLDENSPAGSIIMQEITCFKKSLSLDVIQMSQVKPSLLMTFFYPLLVSITITLFSFLFSLLGSVKSLQLDGFLVLYLIVLSYCFLGGFAYKSYLNNSNTNHSYLCYVYVCMYSMTYLPFTLALSMVLGSIGSIFMFALVLVTQFWISGCMLNGYDFESNKQRFLFSILTVIIQFVFLLSVEAYVRASVMKSVEL